MSAVIQDEKGRYFKSLRLSVLPYCNFACVYCAEAEQKSQAPPPLNPEQFCELISKVNPFLNLYSVRITGGEPTLYKDLPKLVYGLKKIGIPKVYLTTNGVRLERLVSELKDSGLDAINISLDAIDPKIFEKISRRDHIEKTLKGLDSALKEGFFVKLNCTVMKGLNDSQIMPLLEFSREHNLTIRYLELMEMGPLYNNNHSNHFFGAQDILNQISKTYPLKELPRKRSSTARYWQTNKNHRFGIIANYSLPFCSDCNRLRMDHTGKVYGCLSKSFGSQLSTDLTDEAVVATLKKELEKKQPVRFQGSALSMMAIGG